MNNYNETEQAEMTGRLLEASESHLTEWVGYGDVDGVSAKATYMTTENDEKMANASGDWGNADWCEALVKVEEIDEDGDVVKTLWEK